MHERAKHFSIHHLFLLLKVQFIKCSAAARDIGGGDVDSQSQRSVKGAAQVLKCHLIMFIFIGQLISLKFFCSIKYCTSVFACICTCFERFIHTVKKKVTLFLSSNIQ